LVGKSGVTLVNDMNQMSTAIKYAEDTTMNNKILIEEYLPGPDLVLISFVNKGSLFPVCLLDELNGIDSQGRIFGQGFKTHSLITDDKVENRAIEIASLMVKAFKIECLPFLVSFRQDSQGGLRVIEVHLDLGGDLLIEEVFPRALPFDFLEMIIRVLAGEEVIPPRGPIKPTAIFFKKGEGLISDKPFQIFSGESQKDLENKISKAGL